MIVWEIYGDQRIKENRRISLHPPKASDGGSLSGVFSDKVALIETLLKLREAGNVSFSEDIVVVAEGCDDGNYLPLIITALTLDGTPREIRLFLTNGNDAMIQTAAKVGYRALHARDINPPNVHGGICNAFDRYPSKLDEFPKSQKIFIPFRLGAVGSYSEIEKLIGQRIPVMGQSGMCALCLLLDTEKTRTMLQTEHRERLIFRKKTGYIEYFRPLDPPIIPILKRYIPYDQLDQILDSLKNNPKSREGHPTYPCVTAFSGLPDVVKLVEASGGRILNSGLLKVPHETITDRKNDIDMCPVWISPVK
ncbi:MAG: hypothetical protein HW387_1195 [Parachlamydiales bacterium]|nr:hypothetical protein [Parachlamydiales bacterium]